MSSVTRSLLQSRRKVLGLLGGGVGLGFLTGSRSEMAASAAGRQGSVANANPTSIVNLDPTIQKGVPLTDWESYKSRPPTPSVDQHLTDPALVGAIDLHAHGDPDAYPRQWDCFEIARLCKERGMRGYVFKNHYTETAGYAYLVRKYANVPGFEAFGAVSLDLPVGGVNPQAIRYMADVAGHYGRIVWMPTHDTEQEVKSKKEGRPFVRVAKDSQLLPEVLEALDVIAQNDLTLATGHASAEEAIMIMKEAKKRGVQRIIMTHPFANMSVDQLKVGTSLGAFFEVTAGQVLPATAPNADANRQKKVLDAIRQIGPDMTIISSDSGLTGGLNHTDALALAAKSLRTAGFTEPELTKMFKQNPAHLVKLPIL
jgi:hypothetical protein